MKFSLRSLMIVVTLICVVLGVLVSRAEFLSRRASFHRDEAWRLHDEMMELGRQGKSYGWSDALLVRHHDRLAEAYTRAMYRPWTIVDDTPPQYDAP